MKDRYQRTIDYMRVSVTDRCNLRCRYCMPAEGVPSRGHEAILSYEELERICAAGVRLGVRKIRVTGGEPLVRSDIVGFIRRLATMQGAPEVVLTTNGLRLEEMAGELGRAGLARVNVSLDTLRPRRFPRITRRWGLEKVLKGIEAAERAGLTPIKINMVPILGCNADEVIDFGRLAIERDWEVRFIEFMPVGSKLGFSEGQRYPLAAIRRDLEKGVGPLTPLEGEVAGGPARRFATPEGKGRVGIIPAASEHFCAECNRLRITADGKVRPCLFSTSEIDLRSVLRSGATAAQLEELLATAAVSKPLRHRIGEADFQASLRPMSGIGG